VANSDKSRINGLTLAENVHKKSKEIMLIWKTVLLGTSQNKFFMLRVKNCTETA
jgi:hypothetical protein